MQQCSSRYGTFICSARDHYRNLRCAINPQSSGSVPESTLTDFILEVTTALAGESTAAVLDPEYSAAQAVDAGIIHMNAGLVFSYGQ